MPKGVKNVEEVKETKIDGNAPEGAINPQFVPSEPEGVEVKAEEVKPEEQMVTLTAANPMQKLEVSINGMVYSGSSITVPKAQEGDIRRILEGAGMYVRN